MEEALVADAGLRSQRRFLVGSQELHGQPELQPESSVIISTDPAVVAVLNTTLASDYAHAAADRSAATFEFVPADDRRSAKVQGHRKRLRRRQA